jgi:hypothetical protein
MTTNFLFIEKNYKFIEVLIFILNKLQIPLTPQYILHQQLWEASNTKKKKLIL